jgi:hypothetical protein
VKKYPDIFVKYTTVCNYLIETVKYIFIIRICVYVAVSQSEQERCGTDDYPHAYWLYCTGYDMHTTWRIVITMGTATPTVKP